MEIAMNSRERVMLALSHREPDRVPLELGGAGITSASPEMQKRLRECLGLKTEPDPDFPYFDDALQKHLGIDFRAIHLKGVPGSERRRADGTPVDEWGVHSYHDAHDNPLRDMRREDLKHVPWPQPVDPRMVEGLRDYAKTLYEHTEYALVGSMVVHGFFEGGCRLRGYEQFITDCALDPDWVRAFFDVLLDIGSQRMDAYLDAVGDYLHVLWLGDDVCTQRGPYISPPMYRRLVKPYFAEQIRRIKQKTNAHIMHHCCGACYKLIPDYLDIGVEVINPVQPEATDMEHTRLKAEFGDRLSFWGGIGMQHVLTEGKPRDVEAAVKAAFQTLGKGGGYVLAATHTFTEDVPPENILALYEAGRNCTYREITPSPHCSQPRDGASSPRA